MTKVNRVQAVITHDEMSDLIKESSFQKRTISNMIRKYIIEGVKRDFELRGKKEDSE